MELIKQTLINTNTTDTYTKRPITVDLHFTHKHKELTVRYYTDKCSVTSESYREDMRKYFQCLFEIDDTNFERLVQDTYKADADVSFLRNHYHTQFQKFLNFLGDDFLDVFQLF